MEGMTEQKTNIMISKYSMEIHFYESLMKKLDEEMRLLKEGGQIENTMAVLAEKSVIISNLDSIERQIKPLKTEYLIAKEKTGFCSRDLDKLLIKLSFLLEELIRVQSRNAELLQKNMEYTRVKINNVKKRVLLVNRYKHIKSEGLFLQEDR
jgi:flagellar biosynthesis/type III secretory pathway chaperone